MRRFVFIGSCLAWMAAMAAMAALGPLGRYPLVTGVLYCAAFWFLILMVRWFPDAIAPMKALGVVFLLAIAARSLFITYPVGNDVYRYVWEGYVQNFGVNPYRLAPENPALAEFARTGLQTVWDNINHKNFSAVYPPLSLLLFKFLAAFKPNPVFFKLCFIGFDLGVIVVLALICRLRRVPFSRLLLYTANPLVIVYTAGEGHLDVVQVFFLCLGLYILFRGQAATAFFMIGLSVMTKYLAVIALPFLITRKNWKASLTCLLPAGLFLLYRDAGWHVFHSLERFGLNLHYNDSLMFLLRLILPEALAVTAAGLLLVGMLAWIFLVVPEKLQSVYLAIGAALLCLPTLHPWYLIMIAPFLVFYPSAAWIYLQAAVALTLPVLAAEQATGIFQEIHWIKLIEYGPFFGLLFYGVFRDGFLFRDSAYSNPRTLSVIVPTLNEADKLTRCITSLKERRYVPEIIVADGGSTDATVKLALDMEATVVCGPKGRGVQIRNGSEAATGDLLMVLHADCVLRPGTLTAVFDHLRLDPHAPGGAIGMRFEEATASARIISTLNNLRAQFTGIAFGDQAQFVRRPVLQTAGGFPDLMLMEDVELSLLLKEQGRPIFIGDGVRVSSRRWQGRGFSAKIALVLKLVVRFLIERRLGEGARSGRDYYAAYYRL
ncbi:MAG: TIGR04283 family arsenosugar biosynthesis glycosyltransferase [Desulfobacterales bacterium]